MTKKYLLILLSLVCFIALTACSPAGTNTAAAQTAASASADGSQGSASAETTANVGSTPDRTLTDAGISIGAVIKEDSLNKNLANDDRLKALGESIEAVIDGDTLTFYVTPDQDILQSEITPELQAAYQAEMEALISELDEQYDGFPDTTFIYTLMNKSGDTLLTLTQEYIEK